ncbi:unnamed protein product [Prunus armeniaca]|uniref:Uncharacterized protein n=1 Tax=Prunus armeniaca TaxID=36596 RepID=A0A6J5UC08_PRUAR|nr:unnamed protein product [Prunus armeniaca]CAB4303921.1 unnamed protein product [Prunus armeniaca]
MEYEVHGNEPVSPTGQCLNSSVLSMSILGVLEFEIPINESKILSFLQDVFLNISPRFSSIMVDINGEKQWKRVEVKLRDHVHVPIFPSGMSPKSYDDHFQDYISNIILAQYPKDKPLWEVHIIKYPTSSAAGNLIFKLHHALGDGYSFMSALLSCLQRADNPLPLTLPSRRGLQRGGDSGSIFRRVSETSASVFDTLKDFSWNSLFQDDRTPIRSGNYGVEFLPMTVSSITFSLDEIKLIKTKLNVTVNDVISGALFFATRLYMQEKSQKSSTASCTALVLVNTRITHGDYKPIKEIIKPDSEMPWGNRMAFMPVTMPKLTEFSNPLDFVFKAQKLIKRKRSSFAVYINNKMSEIVKKISGYEGASRYMHSRLKNSSFMISNMIGPTEQMALADHPVRGVYFMVLGIPQDLIVTVVSYMGKLRIAFGTQKGLIDPEKFKACMENAFKMILEATDNIPTQAVADPGIFQGRCNI